MLLDEPANRFHAVRLGVAVERFWFAAETCPIARLLGLFRREKELDIFPPGTACRTRRPAINSSTGDAENEFSVVSGIAPQHGIPARIVNGLFRFGLVYGHYVSRCEYGIGGHSKKSLRRSAATDYPNLAGKAKSAIASTMRASRLFLHRHHLQERPPPARTVPVKMLLLKARTHRLHPTLETVTVHRSIFFNLTTRIHCHEKLSSRYCGFAYSRHAGIGGRAAGIETHAQQRRTEEGRPCGIFLPRPKSACTGAQRRGIPVAGRQDDVGRVSGRLRLFDCDPAEIPGPAGYRNQAQRWRIRIAPRPIRLRLHCRRQD